MNDEEANEFYADPGNITPAGPGHRRAKNLDSHVPVRFPARLISDIKAIASDDGKTVSAWIRDVVVREVARRRPRYPQSRGSITAADVDFGHNSLAATKPMASLESQTVFG